MIIESLEIEGSYVITSQMYPDNRGHFYELYNKKELLLKEIECEFVQDNVSFSKKGVLRGIHTQRFYPQAKFVTCLEGRVFDVIVDCRKDSPTFMKWHSECLDSKTKKSIYIPSGVAHGFYAITDSLVLFKVSTHYHEGDEIGFKWDDPQLNIEWPFLMSEKPIVAKKDENLPTFQHIMSLI